MASGFQSLRRFNSAFAEANHVAPRELRRKPKMPAGNALVLRLGYRPPYDFTALLAFLASWLHVSLWPGEAHALKLELFNVPPAQMLPVVTRIRRMFDLDADPQAIVATLGAFGRALSRAALARRLGRFRGCGAGGVGAAGQRCRGTHLGRAPVESFW